MLAGGAAGSPPHPGGDGASQSTVSLQVARWYNIMSSVVRMACHKLVMLFGMARRWCIGAGSMLSSALSM